MTAQERFAEDWKMPLQDVQRVRRLAKWAGKGNEHYCNGDPHEDATDQTDKNECAKLWAAEVDAASEGILLIVRDYGFTAIEYTGLGPTLKRGEQFVEVPY
jgi:hypothetical protein